jgi:exosortase/archaeosortase family protein
MAAAAVPLAIALNAVRITLTGAAALRFGPAAARGTVHEATGAAVFVVAIACVCAMHWRRAPRLAPRTLETA